MKAMNYLRGPERSQVQLLPACLDDYVDDNSPARFIDAYAEGLDFRALGFAHAEPNSTGRPCYHPADLLKLYLYGYLNRIRSSRRLEAEAARNLDVIWLLRGLRPDFKTIADFRRDNRASFKALFQQFNLLCRRLGLFGAELVAIDGSKFKALNNSRRHYTSEQMRELIQKMQSRIDEYLSELDHQDAQAEGAVPNPKREELREKIAQLKERRGRYDELLGNLGADKKEIALTDPDCRKMRGAHGEHFLGYNVQVAVDAKHDLIVVAEVTQAANDRGQLSAMADAAKEQLQAASLRVVADKGYHEADQLEACERAGVETFVPVPGNSGGQGKDGRAIFSKQCFRYNALNDTYHCPGGQSLPRAHRERKDGKERIVYYSASACRNCPLKTRCTSGAYRRIARRINEVVVERAAARVAGHPEIVAQRKKIVEHVFGTMRLWDHDNFLMRGLEKVRAEANLSALVFNIRRVLNTVNLTHLLSALRA